MKWISYSLQLAMCFTAFCIFLTLGATDDSDNTYRYLKRLARNRRRETRQAVDTKRSSILRDAIGERNCTEEEEQKLGCLAGKCIAKVQSQVHTFIICSCPSNRRGARCEEVNIDIEGMAAELQKLEPDELCKQERYDILAKSAGYESRFLDCVKKNYKSDLKKQRKREKKRKERERKRRRKLRRRQRRRERRLRLKASKKTSDSVALSDSDEENISDLQDSLELTSTERTIVSRDLLSSLRKSKRKRQKDHTGHSHVRHQREKLRSKRSQRPLVLYLTGKNREQ